MQQKRHQRLNSKPTEETDCNLLSVDITMQLQQTNNLYVKDEINKTIGTKKILLYILIQI